MTVILIKRLERQVGTNCNYITDENNNKIDTSKCTNRCTRRGSKKQMNQFIMFSAVNRNIFVKAVMTDSKSDEVKIT